MQRSVLAPHAWASADACSCLPFNTGGADGHQSLPCRECRCLLSASPTATFADWPVRSRPILLLRFKAAVAGVLALEPPCPTASLEVDLSKLSMELTQLQLEEVPYVQLPVHDASGLIEVIMKGLQGLQLRSVCIPSSGHH